MNNIINVPGQLELGFNRNLRPASVRQKQTRIERAAWWFDKMRVAVDGAMAWSATPTPPPQQIWLTQPQPQTAS